MDHGWRLYATDERRAIFRRETMGTNSGTVTISRRGRGGAEDGELNTPRMTRTTRTRRSWRRRRLKKMAAGRRIRRARQARHASAPCAGAYAPAQQVLAVVVAVRRAHDDVDVLVVRHVRVRGELPQVRRRLVIELDRGSPGSECGSRTRSSGSVLPIQANEVRVEVLLRPRSIFTRACPSSMLPT